MLAAGLSLPIIGHVFGHKSPQTTQKYAHLADQVRQDAARIMGEQIERSTQEGAERLRRKRAAGESKAGTSTAAAPMGGKVIRFPGKPQR